MKKIERLREIEAKFGKEFVLPYRLCSGWPQITKAIGYFERRGITWGLRTDTRDGTEQGYGCPFLFRGSVEEAQKIFQTHGRKLYYIVCENVPEVLLHGVAWPAGEDDIFIEFNDKEPDISQRAMYNNPKNLRIIAVGPSNLVMRLKQPVRCFSPIYVRDKCFDEVYRLMMCHREVKEITFSVRAHDHRLIIW